MFFGSSAAGRNMARIRKKNSEIFQCILVTELKHLQYLRFVVKYLLCIGSFDASH